MSTILTFLIITLPRWIDNLFYAKPIYVSEAWIKESIANRRIGNDE